MDETIKQLETIADLLNEVSKLSPEAGETLKRSLGDIDLRASARSAKSTGSPMTAEQRTAVTAGEAFLSNFVDTVKDPATIKSIGDEFSVLLKTVASYVQEVGKIASTLKSTESAPASGSKEPEKIPEASRSASSSSSSSSGKNSPLVITSTAETTPVKIDNQQFKELFGFDPVTVKESSSKLISFKSLMQRFADLLVKGGVQLPRAVSSVLNPDQTALFSDVHRSVTMRNPGLSGAKLNAEVEAELRRVYREAVSNLFGSVGLVTSEGQVAALGQVITEETARNLSKNQANALLKKTRSALNTTERVMKRGKPLPAATATVDSIVEAALSDLLIEYTGRDPDTGVVSNFNELNSLAGEVATQVNAVITKRYASTGAGVRSFRQSLNPRRRDRDEAFGIDTKAGSQIVGFEPTVVFPVGFQERVVKEGQALLTQAQQDIANGNILETSINGNAVSLPATLARRVMPALQAAQRATSVPSVMGGEVTTGKQFAGMFNGSNADASAIDLLTADLIRKYIKTNALPDDAPATFASELFGDVADEQKQYSTPAEVFVAGLLENLERDAAYQEKTAYEASTTTAREIANTNARRTKQQIAYVKKLISKETTDQERAYLLTGLSTGAGITVEQAVGSLFGAQANATEFANFAPNIVNYANQLISELGPLGVATSRRPYETQSSAVRVAAAVANQVGGDTEALSQLRNLKNMSNADFVAAASERSVGGQPYAALEFFSDYFGLGVQRGDRGGTLAAAQIASSYLDAEGNIDLEKLKQQYEENPQMTRRNLQSVYYARTEAERRDIPLVKIAQALQTVSAEERQILLSELSQAAPGMAMVLESPATVKQILAATKNPTGQGQLIDVMSAIAPSMQAAFAGYVAKSAGIDFDEARALLAADTVSPEFAPIANMYKQLSAEAINNPASSFRQGFSFINAIDLAANPAALDFVAKILGETDQLAAIRAEQQADITPESMAGERYAVRGRAAAQYQSVTGMSVETKLRELQEAEAQLAKLRQEASVYAVGTPARADLDQRIAEVKKRIASIQYGKTRMNSLAARLTVPNLSEEDRRQINAEIALREEVYRMTGGYDVSPDEGFGSTQEDLAIRAQRKKAYLDAQFRAESGTATAIDKDVFAQLDEERQARIRMFSGDENDVGRDTQGALSFDPEAAVRNSFAVDDSVVDMVRGTPLAQLIDKVEISNNEYLRSGVDLSRLFYRQEASRNTVTAEENKVDSSSPLLDLYKALKSAKRSKNRAQAAYEKNQELLSSERERLAALSEDAPERAELVKKIAEREVKIANLAENRDLFAQRESGLTGMITSSSVFKSLQTELGYDLDGMFAVLDQVLANRSALERSQPAESSAEVSKRTLDTYVERLTSELVPDVDENALIKQLAEYDTRERRGQKLSAKDEIGRTFARDQLRKLFARRIARTFSDSPKSKNLQNIFGAILGSAPPRFLVERNDPDAVMKDVEVTRMLQMFSQLDEKGFAALEQIDPTNMSAYSVDRVLTGLEGNDVQRTLVDSIIQFLNTTNVGQALALNPLNADVAANRALVSARAQQARDKATGERLFFDLETSVAGFGETPRIFQYADSGGQILESSAGLSEAKRAELAQSITNAAMQGTQIVGHNIRSFDLPYLFGGAENVPAAVREMTVDTLEMANDLGIPGSRTLSGLAKFFGIEVDPTKLHTAGYDVELNKQVYAALLKQQQKMRTDPEKAQQAMVEQFIEQINPAPPAPPPPLPPLPVPTPLIDFSIGYIPRSIPKDEWESPDFDFMGAATAEFPSAYTQEQLGVELNSEFDQERNKVLSNIADKAEKANERDPQVKKRRDRLDSLLTKRFKILPNLRNDPRLREEWAALQKEYDALSELHYEELAKKRNQIRTTDPEILAQVVNLRALYRLLYGGPPVAPAAPVAPPARTHYNAMQRALFDFTSGPLSEKDRRTQAARMSYLLANVRALDLLQNAQLSASGNLELVDNEGQPVKGDEAANRLYKMFGIDPNEGFTPEQFADARKRAAQITSAYSDYRLDGSFDGLERFFDTVAKGTGVGGRYTPEALTTVEAYANEMPEGFMSLLSDPLSNLRTYTRRRRAMEGPSRADREATGRAAAVALQNRRFKTTDRYRSRFVRRAPTPEPAAAPTVEPASAPVSVSETTVTPSIAPTVSVSAEPVKVTPARPAAVAPPAEPPSKPPSSGGSSGGGGAGGSKPPSGGGFMGGGGGGGSYRIDSSGSLSFRGPINISTLDARTATFSASKIEIAASNVAIQIQKGATTGIDVKQIVQKGTELPSRRGAPSLLNIQQNTGAYSGAGTQTVHAGAGTTFVGGVGGGGGSYFDSLMSNKATLDLLRSQFKNRQGRFAGVDRETARKLLEQETQNFTLTALKEMQPVEVLDTAKYTGTNPDGTLTPAEALRQSIQSQIAEITDPANIDAVTANFSERIVRLAENITELEKLLVEAATTEEQRINITSDLRDINNKLRDVSAETRNTTTVTTQDAAEAKREEDAAARTARIDAEAAARTARMDAEAAARRAAADARRPNEAELLSRGVLSATRTAFDLSGGMLRTGNFAAGRAQLIQQTADTLREATGLQRVMDSLSSVTGSSSAAVAEFANRVLAVNNAAEAGNLEEMAQALVELVSNAADLQQEIATAPDLTEEQRSAILEPLSAFSARASQADYIKPTAGVIETVERKNLNVLEEQLQAAASRPSFLGISRDRSQRRALSEYAQMRFGEAGANLIYNERAMRFQARTENGGRIDLTEASSSDLNRLREDLAAAGTPIGLEELQQLQRVMAKVQQTRNQTPFADPIFFLSSRIRDLQTLGQTAMSVLNFPQTAAGLIEQTASPALNAVRSMTALRGLSRDQSTFNRAMAAASQQQALFGGSLTSNIGSITSFVPLANTYGVDISKVVNVARKLAAFDPAQGMEGASIAIKEFLSGNVASLSRRFEINRSALSKINAGDATDMLDSLDALLNGMGVTDQLINEAANSRAAQYDKMLGRLETLNIRVSEELVNRVTPLLDYILGPTSALGRQAEQLTIGRMRDESLKFAGNKGLVDAEGNSRLDQISLFDGSGKEFAASVDEVLAAANTEIALASARYQRTTGITPLVEPYRLLENMKPEERVRLRARAQQYALFNQMTPEQAILQASRDVGGDYASYQEFINQRTGLQANRLSETAMRKDPRFIELRRNAELELVRQASRGNTMGLNARSSGRIESVIDADTIRIEGRTRSARLLGVDATESSSKDMAATMAKAVEAGLVANENITFQVAGQDEFNRDLIVAYNSRGEMINSELLAMGAVSAFGGSAVEELANFVADQGIGVVNQKAASLGLGGLPTISEEARQRYYNQTYFGGVLGATQSVGASAAGGAAMYGGIQWLANSAFAPTNAFTTAMVGAKGAGLLGLVGLGAAAGVGLYAGGTALYDRNDTSVGKMRELMKIQQEINKETRTRRTFEAVTRETMNYRGLSPDEVALAGFQARSGRGGSELARIERFRAQANFAIAAYEELTPKMEKFYNEQDDAAKAVLDAVVFTPFGQGGLNSLQQGLQEALAITEATPEDQQGSAQYKQAARFAEVARLSITNAELLKMSNDYAVGADLTKLGLSDQQLTDFAGGAGKMAGTQVLTQAQINSLTVDQAKAYMEQLRIAFESPATYQVEAKQYTDQQFEERMQRRQKGFSTFMEQLALNNAMGLFGGKPLSGAQLANRQFNKSTFLAAGLYDPNAQTALKTAAEESVKAFDDVSKYNKQMAETMAPYVTALQTTFANYANAFKRAGDGADQLRDYLSNGDPMFALNEMRRISGLDWRSLVNQQMFLPQTSQSALFTQLPYLGVQSQLQRPSPMVAQGIDRLNGYQMPFTSGPRGRLAYANSILNNSSVTSLMNPSEMLNLFNMGIQAQTEMAQRNMQYNIQMRDMALNHNRQLEDITRNAFRQLEGIHLNATRQMVQAVQQRELTKRQSLAQTYSQLGSADISEADRRRIDSTAQAAKKFADQAEQSNPAAFLRYEGRYTSENTQLLDQAFAAYDATPVTDLAKRDSTWKTVMKYRDLVVAELEKEMQTADPARKASLQAQRALLGRDPERGAQAQAFADQQISTLMQQAENRKALEKRRDDLMRQKQYSGLEYQSLMQNLQQAQQTGDPLQIQQATRALADFNFQQKALDNELQLVNRQLKNLIDVAPLWSDFWTEGYTQIENTTSTTMSGLINQYEDFNINLKQQIQDALLNLARQKEDVVRSFTDAATEIAQQVPATMAKGLSAILTYTTQMQGVEAAMSQGKFDLANSLAYAANSTLAQALYGDANSPEGKALKDQLAVDASARNVPGSLDMYSVDTPLGKALRVFTVTQASPPPGPTPFPQPSGLGVFTP